MLSLAKRIDRLNELIGRGVSWLALLMVLVGAYNALARFVDRSFGTDLSSNTWLETQWYLFAAMFLFAASWGLQRNAHVRVDVLYSKLSTRGRAWTELLGTLLLMLPFCLFVLWAVWPTVVESWSIREMSPDPGGLARWPIRAAVPIAFALLFLQGVSVALTSLDTILRGERNADPDGDGSGTDAVPVSENGQSIGGSR